MTEIMSRHRAVRGNWQDEIADDGYEWEIKMVSKAVPGADKDWIIETLEYYDGDTEATIEYLQREIGSTVCGKKHLDFIWENDVLIVGVLQASVPICHGQKDNIQKKVDLKQLAGAAAGKRKFSDLISKNSTFAVKTGAGSLGSSTMNDVVWSSSSSLVVAKPSAFAALVTNREQDNIALKFRNQLTI